MSRLPDSSSVNRGSWTEPLAKTRSPAGGGGGAEVIDGEGWRMAEERKQSGERERLGY